MKSFVFLVPVLLFVMSSCELVEDKDLIASNSKDTIPPVLQLNGEALDTAYLFTDYADPGVKLLDEKAGDLFIYREGKVETSGEVNMRVPDSYVITYSAKDAAPETLTIYANSTYLINLSHATGQLTKYISTSPLFLA